MKIEKISKFVMINDQRRVLISLPRIKWLERQPDYKPWPPLEDISKTEPEPRPARYDCRPQARNYELTERQKQAWDLHSENKSHKEIAEILGSTTNAVGKLLEQAREKLGVGL